MLPRTIFDAEHDAFRASARAFIRDRAVPHTDRWEEQGFVDRDYWEAAAAQGFVGFAAPEELGGVGIRDFRYNAILDEEMMYAAAVGDGFSMANDVIAPYLVDLADEAQQARWLPGFTAGRLIVSIAMTEPGAGSDLRGLRTTAARADGGYVLNGSKTFVTSGIQADLVIVVARTEDHDGALSLFAVPADSAGFSRGRKLAKVGRRGHDTAELFFSDVFVPDDQILGEPGRGLAHLKGNLPQERMSHAVMAVAASEQALEMTIAYCQERHAFGQAIGSFQANRHALADLSTEVAAARALVDAAIAALAEHRLSGEDAARAKLFSTELQSRVMDRCLQLHGGYGYMDEYVISRLWRDGRVQRIYGGTSEIMREIVGRSLGL